MVAAKARQARHRRSLPPSSHLLCSVVTMIYRLAMVCILALAGCAPPVGINYVDTSAGYRSLTASALSGDTLTATSKHVLNREGMSELFQEDPEEALKRLHASLAKRMGNRRLFALSELSFLHGQRTKDRSYFLASAIYAYALLFPEVSVAPLARSDPRLRLTYDFYNSALSEALAVPSANEDSEATEVVIEPGKRPLPFGSIDITANPADFYWVGHGLYRFVPAAKLEVRGLRNRYRRPGIGAPLAASLYTYKTSTTSVAGAERIPPRLKVPVTALLRIQRPRASLLSGMMQGKLSLYTADAESQVTINDRHEPLEFEGTAALAYTLEGAMVWDFELAGFLSAGLLQEMIPKDRAQDGLFFMKPFDPNKIPLVLVHGTASSPGTWAEMINELDADPKIRDHYQVWLFIYTTGNPIAYSGARLRTALRNVVKEMDPRGQYPALQRMVVVGHSQGGLLTKLTAIDSGAKFWDGISETPFEELKVDPEAKNLLRDALFYKPLPFVKRVVFISTPQRGSFLATGWVTDIAGYFVKLPGGLLRRSFDALVQSPDIKLIQKLNKPPTSVHNMSPHNPFIQKLATIPVSPGIKAHSIIAVQGNGPPEEGSDGVVKYQSAHIDGVESELVVRSGHSSHRQPASIEEMRRILYEHHGTATTQSR